MMCYFYCMECICLGWIWWINLNFMNLDMNRNELFVYCWWKFFYWVSFDVGKYYLIYFVYDCDWSYGVML